MRRLHIFLIDESQEDNPRSKAAFYAVLDRVQGAEPILANHYDCSGEMPRAGDRPLSEYKKDPAHIDPLFPGSDTHSRAGAWMVVREPEVFVSDLPIARSYDELTISYCVYEPIPEEENPWIAINRPSPQVTVDSFGGDTEAYQRWTETEHGQAVRSREAAQA